MIIVIMTGGWRRVTTYLVPRCCCPYRTKRVVRLTAAAADAVIFQDCPLRLAREKEVRMLRIVMIIVIMTGGWRRLPTYLVLRSCCPFRTKRVVRLAAAAAYAVILKGCPLRLARDEE